MAIAPPLTSSRSSGMPQPGRGNRAAGRRRPRCLPRSISSTFRPCRSAASAPPGPDRSPSPRARSRRPRSRGRPTGHQVSALRFRQRHDHTGRAPSEAGRHCRGSPLVPRPDRPRARRASRSSVAAHALVAGRCVTALPRSGAAPRSMISLSTLIGTISSSKAPRACGRGGALLALGREFVLRSRSMP